MKPVSVLKKLLLAVAVLLVLGQVIGWLAIGRIEAALGEGATLGSARLGPSGVVVLSDLRLGTPEGWPAKDTLTLGRVVVRPAWTTLLSPQIRLHSVSIEDAYLALRRTRRGVQVVPTLTQPAAKAEPGEAGEPWTGSLQIARITLEDGTVEVFDENVPRPPLKLRLEQVQLQLDDLLVPTLASRVTLALTAKIKGEAGDGELAVNGWAQWDRRESSIHTVLKGLDLMAVRPYIDRGDLGLQQGRFDLDLQSETRGQRLKAQGQARLGGLEFARGPGIKGSFLGVPKVALIKVMEAGRGEIPLKFRLDGDLDDPQFSLQEALPLRLAVGLAEAVGLSVKGVVSGVGSFGSKGVEAVGDAFGSLFGGRRKPADEAEK